MNYKLLGKSGLRVSELCLGTMTFGEEWGWGANKDESKAVFDAFVEAGGNFLDTADGYTNGTSEKFVGEFIRGKRDQFVVATKFSFNQRRGDPNAGGNHRKNMAQALEGSLKRLGTDRIDLYWMHAWDELTPIEEVMRAFDDFVRAGKVLYIGISDAPAWWVARANTLAELRGWTQFVGTANRIQSHRAHAGARIVADGRGAGADGHAVVAAGERLAHGKIRRQIKGGKAARQDAAICAAHRTQRSHRPDGGQNREGRRKISRAGRAQLAARAAQHHSDHRRAKAFATGGQSELRQMVVEREAARAAGRGQQD